jgi:RNA polymerase sigma-70 factor (ECF subfamily)
MGDRRASREFLDRATEHIIRDQARRVVRRSGLAPFDREDIAQDLRLHLWLQRDRYDDGRGSWTTFARCVVERKAAVLLGHFRAERRNRRHVAYAFDGPLIGVDGESVSGIDRLDRDVLRRDGPHARDKNEIEPNRRLDVGAALRNLSSPRRGLARRLMQFRVAEIARLTGVPRGTLYERIAEIRSAFLDQGVGKQSGPTFRHPNK